jgi:hypothetical protein
MWNNKIRPGIVLIFFYLAAPVTLGCHKLEEIRRYQVPKETHAEETPGVPGRVRLLAAMLPHEADTWFFKLVGPTPEVTEHEATFHQFLESIRFPRQGTEAITWTVPEGWQYEGPKEFRYCTFRFGAKDKPLELTVFKFGGQAGSALANVNRWRGRDLGLGEIGPSALSRYTKAIKVAGIKVTLVDMTGPGASRGGM